MHYKKIKPILIGITLILGYLFFTSPDKVVVDEQGQIDGLFNKARAFIQRSRFWENQLAETGDALKWELEEPKRDREFQASLDRKIESLYQEYPEMRPTPAESQAEALRELADRIEEQEVKRELEQFRIKRIAELRKIQSIIQERLKAF